MKKIITTLSICALAFVACNDNKDKPPPPAAATKAEGKIVSMNQRRKAA